MEEYQTNPNELQTLKLQNYLVHLSLKSDFLIIVDFLICLYKSIIVGISQVQQKWFKHDLFDLLFTTMYNFEHNFQCDLCLPSNI